MSSSRAKGLLIGLLYFNSVVTLCALPAVFMPVEQMDQIHRQMGLGELPRGTIVQYLARSLSAFYVAFGVFTFALARDVDRYAPLVTWWGSTMLGFGLVLGWVDWQVGMPALWSWGEFGYLLVVGSLVLALQTLANRPTKG